MSPEEMSQATLSLQNRFRGCLLGLASGDAVGTTVEFKRRGTFPLVTDMVGGGPFQLERGEWTDDTSMALCIAASLTELTYFDATDIMDRFCRWKDSGYLSSNGHCFDIGNTVRDALRRYQRSGAPFSGSTDVYSAGNGCLMRLAPIPMFFHADRAAVIEHAALSSRTTHGAEECIAASQLFAAMLHQALLGADKETILSGHGLDDIESRSVCAIAQRAYQTKSVDQIRGSGYVVESLEAALWCFDTTDSFEAAILLAANLGDDADTTAAICGQIAGAFYGESGIPPHWLCHLAKAGTIRKFADRLWQIGSDGIDVDADTDDSEVLQGALGPDGVPCAVIFQGEGSRR
jgi:ADP-ribosyl-[dinitrogen reductase] hydrolase